MAKSLVAALALFIAASADAQSLTGCTEEKLTNAMKACDSMVNISQLKCDNTACHKALHVLVDPDYIKCYEDLKLGPKEDLVKYKELDDFCHGEGPDPLEKDGGNTTGSASKGSEGSDGTDDDVTTPPPTSTSPVPAPAPSAGVATAMNSALGAAIVATALAAVV